MLALAFFRWWYGPGWVSLLKRIRVALDDLFDSFSVPLLLRTLISPWRRIINYDQEGIVAQLRSMLDNAVSRLVGLVVRSIVIGVAILLSVALIFGGIVTLIGWLLLPVAAVVLTGYGLLP